MGWRTISGHRYYYRSRRVDGQVESEYLGSGEVAEAIAFLERSAREEREARRSDERERIEAEERRFSEWFGRVEAVADAALVVAGFHRHKGQWRRRRDGGIDRPGGSRTPGQADLG